MDTGSNLRRFIPVLAVIMVVTLIPLAGKTLTAGLIGSYSRINHPFASVAETLKSEHHPALIVAAGMHLAGNMRLQFPDVPVVNSERSVEGFPPPGAVKGPVLVIWPEDRKPPGALPLIDRSSIDALGLTPSPPQSLSHPHYYGDGKTGSSLGYLWLR